jgi:hypothetical protein
MRLQIFALRFELEVRSWFLYVRLGRHGVYLAPGTGLSCWN